MRNNTQKCVHVLPVKWVDLSQSPRAMTRITQLEV